MKCGCSPRGPCPAGELVFFKLEAAQRRFAASDGLKNRKAVIDMRRLLLYHLEFNVEPADLEAKAG